MWITKLLEKQIWSFGHMLVGSMRCLFAILEKDAHDFLVAKPFDRPEAVSIIDMEKLAKGMAFNFGNDFAVTWKV
jgi:hypothetical protein